MQLTRTVSRTDIDCPGDTLPFRCSILSNSETIQLTWHIFFPDKMLPIRFTYDNTSMLNNVAVLALNITAVLTSYVKDESAESIITLTVLKGVPMNETKIQCSSEELDNITVAVYVNTAGKTVPYKY